MISFQPLMKSLDEHGMRISDLRKYGVHPEVIATINRNESITVKQLERICITLDCRVENVIEIRKE